MRLPRKIKKAAKYVEFHAVYYTNLYDKFIVKGRRTKWKLKYLNKAKESIYGCYMKNGDVVTALLTIIERG